MNAVISRLQFILLVDRARATNAPAHGILASALANLVCAVQKFLFALGTVVVARATRADAGRSIFWGVR